VRRPTNARGLGRWEKFSDQRGPMIGELERAGLVNEKNTPPATHLEQKRVVDEAALDSG